MNQLYFGDNLQVLRDHIKDESVDLIYLDPPFNSKATYNVLFRAPNGHESDAQITAFEDSWHWGEQAEREFDEILHQSNTQVAQMMDSFRKFLGENDMMAYLVMMANRLLELHRVLKSTGSLYLHCDPTASHYLKVVLDGVFGLNRFVNEIIWKRTTAKSQSFKRLPNNHDTILYYSKGDAHVFNRLYLPLSEERIQKHYYHLEEGTGRRYSLDNLTAPGIRNGPSGDDWRGISIRARGNHWKFRTDKLEEMDRAGLIYWPDKVGGMPRLKRYLDEQEGIQIDSVWIDLPPINSQASESLRYPTQKPQTLLERIIQTSSNEGDIILDPFCGCGTAVHAAEKLGRNWIGIDITHLAISLIEKRLQDAFPGIQFEVHGTPKDLGGARDLATRDKYQFQWWACSLVNAQPYQGKKKGADSGIDGLIFFQDDETGAKKIVVSVKGGDHVTRNMISDLRGVMEREKAEIGLFVTLAEPSKPMVKEAASAGLYHPKLFPKMAFPRIQILTIEELLNGTKRPEYHSIRSDSLTFKEAPRESRKEKKVQKDLFE